MLDPETGVGAAEPKRSAAVVSQSDTDDSTINPEAVHSAQKSEKPGLMVYFLLVG